MKEFKVSLSNRPGELANLAELLGDRRINIVSVAGVSEGKKSSTVTLVTEDEANTREALRAERFQFEEEELLIVDLEDKPGELATVARKLGDAQVNIESLYLLDKKEEGVKVGLEVDNRDKAEGVIS
ncbi:MAG: ACT domain-containing protein [Candidatus Bipolaricaulota bacterium]